MARTRVGIINVTGYAGSELAGILANHPEVELVAVTGRSLAGKRLRDALPYVWQYDLTITPALEVPVDVVFSALPSGVSAAALAPYIEAGTPSIDIAADFRLRDVAEFNHWYGVEHPAPALVRSAVYGLPELHREEIRQSKLIANPGCYATGAILALAPAMRENIVGSQIIVDAKSGISGAGRGGTDGANVLDLYGEANENALAYRIEGHGHLPEITQELSALREAPRPNITFVPHRIPMTRGILATCYADLTKDVTSAQVRELYRAFYADEPFLRVVDTPPQTKHTTGTNLCLVHPVVDTRANRLIVVSCIDNLVKGAAGQAVQNMNLMLGFPETMGLGRAALYP
ncbi:MAG: N-acetyl-gamma-glutamyl-phosphate reductase [Dehalococcoidia bacterium]|nr:N-acetyl-gamma-glutamyl-phosphate reductase [Dehalococcoidia bacterium]